jgi:hypothetical protein
MTICAHSPCGKEFPRRFGKRFCSDPCRIAASRKEATCAICGGKYFVTPGSSRRTFCSDPCRAIARAKHKNETRPKTPPPQPRGRPREEKIVVTAEMVVMRLLGNCFYLPDLPDEIELARTTKARSLLAAIGDPKRTFDFPRDGAKQPWPDDPADRASLSLWLLRQKEIGIRFEHARHKRTHPFRFTP